MLQRRTRPNWAGKRKQGISEIHLSWSMVWRLRRAVPWSLVAAQTSHGSGHKAMCVQETASARGVWCRQAERHVDESDDRHRGRLLVEWGWAAGLHNRRSRSAKGCWKAIWEGCVGKARARGARPSDWGAAKMNSPAGRLDQAVQAPISAPYLAFHRLCPVSRSGSYTLPRHLVIRGCRSVQMGCCPWCCSCGGFGGSTKSSVGTPSPIGAPERLQRLVWETEKHNLPYRESGQGHPLIETIYVSA